MQTCRSHEESFADRRGKGVLIQSRETDPGVESSAQVAAWIGGEALTDLPHASQNANVGHRTMPS